MAGTPPSTLNIIVSALRKLQVIGAADSAPSGEDTEYALSEYNQILGQFNTRRRKAYFMRFKSFTITTARTSYTIGASGNTPTPNFSLSAGEGDRPVRIERAQVVLVSNTPDTFIDIPVFNWPEYSLLTTPGMTGTWPIAIYYSPETPNGVIYPYYSEPSETSNQIRLWWWNQLETVAMADISTALSLPPGLERVLVLRLAIALWPAFAKKTNLDQLEKQERIATADYESNNADPRRVSSTDGMQPMEGYFSYQSRTWI